MRYNANQRKNRLALTLVFSAVIFVFLLITMLIIVMAIILLVDNGWLGVGEYQATKGLVVSVAGVSIILGTLIAAAVGKWPMKPLNALINAMNRLAAGDYKTRLHVKGLMAKYPVATELTDSFNTMAEELENTELLRSDFINNFSHEFKTPIVSIAGFAKLIRRGNLNQDEQTEYLEIIEEESMRLSQMASNMLNLTKVENQSILTDVSRFNLSEQIRNCVLLLESKWSRKELELRLNFDEYTICANEDLLKQVWINLMDNAVKFAPKYGTVGVDISRDGNNLKVSVMNTGAEIPEEIREKIFHKFYQGDESHSKEGNGIGLAVVKRIVELHNGSVSVSSNEMTTVFTVILPAE